MAEFEPSIIAFVCNWCTYAAADLAGTSRTQYPPNVKIVRLMCSGAVDPIFVMKPLLELNDIHLNWKKIILPKNDKNRSFKGTDEEAKLITNTLLEYKHPIMRGIFAFLLTGRRIGETLKLEHKHINYNNDTFTLPKEITKTK